MNFLLLFVSVLKIDLAKRHFNEDNKLEADSSKEKDSSDSSDSSDSAFNHQKSTNYCINYFDNVSGKLVKVLVNANFDGLH